MGGLRTIFVSVLLSLPCVLYAQDTSYMRSMDVERVTVTTGREIKDIGTQKTVVDSFALRENITNSLADVLAQNTTIFIKSYGRGTLSTASFRGTAPSHTQVTWNGMRINSPMLGMVDFSLIPSYFIDDASLYHGASSVGVTEGGLGGVVALGTKPLQEQGLGVRVVQGFGSFNTFDEYARVSYGNDRWQFSTRVYYTQSDNDFKYTNYRRKVHEKDENGQIVNSYYSTERNKNGFFKDLHAMQEVYYNTGRGDYFGLSVWYMDSYRGLPMIASDNRPGSLSKETQDDHTLRAALSWERYSADWKLSANAGYIYTDFTYIRDSDRGTGVIRNQYSKNYLNTLFGVVSAEYTPSKKWLLSGNVSIHQHRSQNSDHKYNVNLRSDTVYKNDRPELSSFVSARYKPTERVGVAVNLMGQWFGKDTDAQLVPAFFADYALTKRGNLLLKASVARNYRYPTLNDLYFRPGGNLDLKPEHGLTYDAGIEYRLDKKDVKFAGEAAIFDSYIDDWILWIQDANVPTPINIKEVRSYGVEIKTKFDARLSRDWSLSVHANYAWTRTENRREPISVNDWSIGKQLPYIPKYSSAATGRLTWRQWEFIYKWQYYSERFTTSTNEKESAILRLTPFYMSDISLERKIDTRYGAISLKVNVNNLFDEQYETVLSRPMAGRNFGIVLGITPKFGGKSSK